MSSHLHRRSIKHLDRDFRVRPQDTDGAVLNVLSALDCPRSLTVWMLYCNKEHQQLVDLKVDPFAYKTAADFRDAYIATEFLSKANFLSLEINRKDAAMKKFFEFEELCRHTNAVFRNDATVATESVKHDTSVAWLLNATRSKIHQVLIGRETEKVSCGAATFDGEEWVEACNWGPGVSTLVKGDRVSATNKFQCETGITRDLHSLVGDWFHVAYPLWGSHLSRGNPAENGFTYEVGNRVVTVPKNAKIDRVIAIEPGLNIWFQLGVGRMIRRRLKRFGIDLNSQERNQKLAHAGSVTNELATVDFSSASDSISRELVRWLLPTDWYMVMDACRSHFGIIDGKARRWEKFSSMGNGFTFELETLIFYAAALASCEYCGVRSDKVSVYGDDVIIPSAAVDTFSKLCAFLGFRMNSKKTYRYGPFRESCGEHWYLGVSCKPLYLKERLSDVSSFYRLANGVRLLANRCLAGFGCDRRFRHAWVRLVSRVPKPLRLWVSRELGDVGFISNFDEACPSRSRDGCEGYLTLTRVEMGVREESDQTGHLLAGLRRIGAGELAHGNTYALRNRTRVVYKMTRVVQWCNLGGWF